MSKKNQVRNGFFLQLHASVRSVFYYTVLYLRTAHSRPSNADVPHLRLRNKTPFNDVKQLSGRLAGKHAKEEKLVLFCHYSTVRLTIIFGFTKRRYLMFFTVRVSTLQNSLL